MIAELERRPPVALPDPPERPFPVQPARVPALQLQLGVTVPATRLEDYGPTSALSEELLFAGYRRAGEETS